MMQSDEKLPDDIDQKMTVEPPSREDIIINIFTFQKPTDETIPKFKAIREAAMEFAKVIDKNCPQCADRAAAIRKVREAVMTANASIALGGVNYR